MPTSLCLGVSAGVCSELRQHVGRQECLPSGRTWKGPLRFQLSAVRFGIGHWCLGLGHSCAAGLLSALLLTCSPLPSLAACNARGGGWPIRLPNLFGPSAKIALTPTRAGRVAVRADWETPERNLPCTPHRTTAKTTPASGPKWSTVENRGVVEQHLPNCGRSVEQLAAGAARAAGPPADSSYRSGRQSRLSVRATAQLPMARFRWALGRQSRQPV